MANAIKNTNAAFKPQPAFNNVAYSNMSKTLSNMQKAFSKLNTYKLGGE